MKTNLVVQAMGSEKNVADVEKMVKEELKLQGVKMTSIDTLDVYYKPVENEVYYVATAKDGSTREGQLGNC